MDAAPSRIDVHQHVLPPAYARILEDRKIDGGWAVPQWSSDAALHMMDAEGIAAGVLSVSAPGVHLGDDREARATARMANEYVAALIQRYPDRFGLFASLPLPDVEGAVAEAVYALDELRADGVVLLSNARGQYPGDDELEPLWAELDARDAVVYIHPAAAPAPAIAGLPAAIVDFPFDTTRAAVQLVRAGVLQRHPRVKVILSHGGGFLPYVAHRIANAFVVGGFGRSFDETLDDLRGFYLETALATGPTALPAMLAFAAPDHVVFGSDWPFLPQPRVAFFRDLLDQAGLDPDQLRDIQQRNAARLVPRLAGVHT